MAKIHFTGTTDDRDPRVAVTSQRTAIAGHELPPFPPETTEQFAIEQSLDSLKQLTGIAASAIVTIHGQRQLVVAASTWLGPVFENSEFQAEVLEIAALAAACQETQQTDHRSVRNLRSLCYPCVDGADCRAILCVSTLNSTRKSPERDEATDVTGQVKPVADRLRQFYSTQTRLHLEQRAEAAAAAVELVQQINRAESLEHAGNQLVNELREFLGCDQVILGLHRRSTDHCRVMAVSGLADFDRHSNQVRDWESVLDESILRNELSSWPPRDSSSPHTLLEHRRLQQKLSGQQIVSLPLNDSGQRAVGAMLLIGPTAFLDQPMTARFLNAARTPIAAALSLSREAEGGWLRGVLRRCLSKDRVRQRQLVLGILTAIIVLGLVPLPYRLNCRCELQPLMRRFSVAQQPGLVEVSLVEPGDVVVRDQVLARMDDREVRFELAALVAQQEQAAKKSDQSLAREDITEAQLAELERDRLAARRRLLEYRQQHLEIRSPVDGIVLSGTIAKHSSAPVNLGDALYEIAPLDQLRLEIQIPAEDYPHVRVGHAVALSIDGLAGTVISGEITRIRPQSEQRDSRNVFVAELIVDNQDGRLRPGMTGHARVSTDRHPLAWNLLHKAWQKAWRLTGWY